MNEEEFFCREMTQPEIIQYMEDRANRIFYLDGYIDENNLCMEIAKNIILLNKKEENITDKTSPIYLYIYCYGGDLAQALMLCDVIENSRIPVYTIALGPAMSSGCVVFLAGHKRYAYPHADLMLHYGKCLLEDNEEIENITEERKKKIEQKYNRSMNDLKEYLLKKISINPALLDTKLEDEWYFSKEEMLIYGIVDKIIETGMTI